MHLTLSPEDLADCGYGVLGTSAVIDETRGAFEELEGEIVRAARD